MRATKASMHLREITHCGRPSRRFVAVSQLDPPFLPPSNKLTTHNQSDLRYTDLTYLIYVSRMDLLFKEGCNGLDPNQYSR